MTKRPFRTGIAALALVLLCGGGCSAFPFFSGDDAPPTLRVTLTGQPDMNSGGNAAVVRIYQLSGASNFTRSPLEAFWRDDEAALGDELVQKREVLLYPEQERSVVLEISEAAQFVGVAANLRNPNREAWRAIYSIPDLDLEEQGVVVSVGDDRITAAVE